VEEAGIERVARSRRVDRLDAVRGHRHDGVALERHRSLLAELRHRARHSVRQGSQPFSRVRAAAERRQLDLVRKEQVRLPQRVAQPPVPAPARIEPRVERRREAGAVSAREERGQVGPEAVLEEEGGNVQVIAAGERRVGHVTAGERRDRSEMRDERAVSRMRDRDGDTGLQARVADDARDVDAPRRHLLQAEAAEEIVTDLPDERDRGAEPREAHRHDRSGAAEHEARVLDEHLPAGGREGLVAVEHEVDVDLAGEEDPLQPITSPRPACGSRTRRRRA